MLNTRGPGAETGFHFFYLLSLTHITYFLIVIFFTYFLIVIGIWMSGFVRWPPPYSFHSAMADGCHPAGFVEKKVGDHSHARPPSVHSEASDGVLNISE